MEYLNRRNSMNVHQLRRWSDQAGNGLKSTGEAAKSGFNRVYTTAMSHPTAASAVLLGTGVAAGLIWLATRNGTLNGARRKVQARVRRAPTRSRRSRAAA